MEVEKLPPNIRVQIARYSNSPRHPGFTEDAWEMSNEGHVAVCDGVSNFRPNADALGYGIKDFRRLGPVGFFKTVLEGHCKRGSELEVIKQCIDEIKFMCGFGSEFELTQDDILNGVDSQPNYDKDRVEKFMSPSGFLARELARILSDVGPLEIQERAGEIEARLREVFEKDPDMIDVAKYYISKGPKNNSEFVVSSTFAVIDSRSGIYTTCGDIEVSRSEIESMAHTSKLGETDALAVSIDETGKVKVVIDRANLVVDKIATGPIHVSTDGMKNTLHDDCLYLVVNRQQ